VDCCGSDAEEIIVGVEEDISFRTVPERFVNDPDVDEN